MTKKVHTVCLAAIHYVILGLGASTALSDEQACHPLGQSFIDSTPDHSAFLSALGESNDPPGKIGEQCLYSPNGKYVLIMHRNGEFATYETVSPHSGKGKLLKRSHTNYPSDIGQYVLQLNEYGNLAVFRSYVKKENFRYQQYTHVKGDKQYFTLSMEDSGDLVLYIGKPGDKSTRHWLFENRPSSTAAPTTPRQWQHCGPCTYAFPQDRFGAALCTTFTEDENGNEKIDSYSSIVCTRSVFD